MLRFTSFGNFGYNRHPFQANQTQREATTVMVSEGCVYRLVILDGGGNGFCCLNGDGWYEIFSANADDESQLLLHGPGKAPEFFAIGITSGREHIRHVTH